MGRGQGGHPGSPPLTFQAKFVELGGHVGDELLGVAVPQVLQALHQVAHHGPHRPRVRFGRPRAQQEAPHEAAQPLPLLALPGGAQKGMGG